MIVGRTGVMIKVDRSAGGPEVSALASVQTVGAVKPASLEMSAQGTA
jgi:hypothetical protein